MTQLPNTESLLKKRQWIEWDQMNAEQRIAELKQETLLMKIRKKLINFLKQRFQSNEE
jgi:hypothetical protein